MIEEIAGDVLAVKEGLICHQVNYYGVMGAGIAAAIRKKMLTETQYAGYVSFCNKLGRNALGKVLFVTGPGRVIIANMFSQDDAHINPSDGGITDYRAMLKCFCRTRTVAEIERLPVYIPWKIGCGIAGGDWATVQRIIRSAFNGSSADVFIVRREKG